MVWQKVRAGLLASVLAAAVSLTVRAEEGPKTAPPAAAAPAVAADCNTPCYRTVCVKEWVPETYQCTRTTCKTEQRVETYTAYRCEQVQEQRTCTVWKNVNEVQTVMKTVCECVPTVEERTVMKSHTVCKEVTTMNRKCVDKGHYECKEVCAGPSLCDRLGGHMHRHHGCGNDCGGCETECAAPRMKTVKVWVPCPTWVETPCTKTVRTCEYRPETCRVTVNKMVSKQVPTQVTVCKKVAETKTSTVCVEKKVPYQATRTVCVKVPVTETVNATRMVCRTVQKQVPVETCASSCDTGCHRGLRHHAAGLFHRDRGCGCDSGCH